MHFRLRHQVKGAHHHVTVFVGLAPNLALVNGGNLVMNEMEWEAFKGLIHNTDADNTVDVMEEK